MRSAMTTHPQMHVKTLVAASCLAAAFGVNTVIADQQILDDLIVDGSMCVGIDCVNGESFGFDTIRLKENNLRIKFQDTSSSASFPTNDWQLTANDSSNGGANKFSIDDIDRGRTPFTVEAGAPSHSLYVDDGGRIGLGTSTPVVEMHVVNGDSPTMRLEQNGSSGFTPQTWDVAGNEANFFIRDATNGSTLPFRIRSGAPSNSIHIDADGNVSMGRDGTLAGSALLISRAGPAKIGIINTTGPHGWKINTGTNGDLKFVYTTDSSLAGGTELLILKADGTIEMNGDVTVNGALNTVTPP
jgi:hypothetical protein